MKRIALACLACLAWPLTASAVVTNVQTRPAGTSGAVQFNDGGVFGSSSTFTYAKSTGDLSVSSASVTFIDGSTAALRMIRWADGTTQITAGAGAGGSYIVNGETLQSGAVFHVSSGTSLYLNVNTLKFGDGTTMTTAASGSGSGGDYWVGTATSPLNMDNYAIFGASVVQTSSVSVSGATITVNGVPYNFPASIGSSSRLMQVDYDGGRASVSFPVAITDGMRTSSTDTVSGAKVFQSSVTIPTTVQVGLPNDVGEIAISSVAYSINQGTIVSHDGAQRFYVVSTTDTPQNDYVPKYDSTSGMVRWETDAGSSGTPGGSNTELQFNNSSSFDGVAVATYNATTDLITFSSATTHVFVGTDTYTNVKIVLSGTSSVQWPDGTIQVSSTVTGGAGTPGGSDTEFQFNDGGSFEGVSVATFNSTSNLITFSSAVTYVNIASQTLTNVNLVMAGTSAIYWQDGTVQTSSPTAGGGAGDIEGVTVTAPVTGGGTSGTVTIGLEAISLSTGVIGTLADGSLSANVSLLGSQIDIGSETNLAVTEPIVLTDDTLSLQQISLSTGVMGSLPTNSLSGQISPSTGIAAGTLASNVMVSSAAASIFQSAITAGSNVTVTNTGLGVEIAATASGGAAPGGTAGMIQYQVHGSSFGGVAIATFNATSNLLTISSAVTVVNVASQTFSNVNIAMSGTSAIYWADGTVQVSSPGAGGGSYINLSETLQSGATFYVSSGSVAGALEIVDGGTYTPLTIARSGDASVTYFDLYDEGSPPNHRPIGMMFSRLVPDGIVQPTYRILASTQTSHLASDNTGDAGFYLFPRANSTDAKVGVVAGDAYFYFSRTGVDVGSLAGESIPWKFYEASDNGTNYVAFKASNTIATDQTYVWPEADGTDGQVLTTDGDGNLAFETAAGGGESYSVYPATSTAFFPSGFNVGNSSLGGSNAIGIRANAYTGASTGYRFFHNAAGANDFGLSIYSNGTQYWNFGTSGIIDVYRNIIRSGTSDTYRGGIDLYGDSGTSGGYIQIHNSAGEDTDYSNYVIEAAGGELDIGTALNPNAWRFGGDGTLTSEGGISVTTVSASVEVTSGTIHTFLFPMPGTAVVGSNKLGVQMIVPFECQIVKARANAGTAPTGADLIFDINYDPNGGVDAGGFTIWSTSGNRLTITDGSATANTTTFNHTGLAAGGTLTIDIDQVGSTVAGANVSVILVVRKTGTF